MIWVCNSSAKGALLETFCHQLTHEVLFPGYTLESRQRHQHARKSKELYAMDALPELLLLKTLKRASCMTVDQVASGKSALARQVAKMRKGAQLPKQELNSSLSL